MSNQKQFIYPSEFPLLDEVAGRELMIRVMEEDLDGAVPEDPRRCVLSKASWRSGYMAWIHRHIAWIVRPATADLIKYNKKVNGITGVRVGDLVRVRFRLTRATLAQQVASLDNGGGFQLGYFYFRAPSYGDRVKRDKATKTRRGRADAYRTGTTPAYTHVCNLHRAAASQDSLLVPLTTEEMQFLGLEAAESRS